MITNQRVSLSTENQSKGTKTVIYPYLGKTSTTIQKKDPFGSSFQSSVHQSNNTRENIYYDSESKQDPARQNKKSQIAKLFRTNPRHRDRIFTSYRLNKK